MSASGVSILRLRCCVAKCSVWIRVILVTSALFSHGFIHATTLPVGEQLVLRLDTTISSRSSRTGDFVQASVMGGSDRSPQFLLLSGAIVEGRIEQVRRGEPLFQHAMVRIRFFRIRFGLQSTATKLRIVEVHNAAESMDAEDSIRGLTPLWMRPAKINVTYKPGTELTAELEEPLDLASLLSESDALNKVTPPDRQLQETAGSQPSRTTAHRARHSSDFTNILFVGEKQQIENAFGTAGWSTADSLSPFSALKTFVATAHRHAYPRAPVSTLLLEGRKPDLVFEKQTNTFAKRHHVRLWMRPGSYGGKPIWLAAATHDIGIRFSWRSKSFTHRIDPSADVERSMLILEMFSTGAVDMIAYIERPEMAHHDQNATGDHIETDGRLAVINLADARSKLTVEEE